MRIGELASKAGVNTSKIRFYEKIGLLRRAERVSGQRWFNSADLQLMRFIQMAQAAGFSIDEIKSLIGEDSAGANIGSQWRERAARTKLDVAEQIARLQHVDRILDRLLQCECDTLSECVERTFASDNE